MKYFSLLAIFISALGLFGLAAYINHLREKEVSIRKVLGAHTRDVFYVLSKDFLTMTGVAFLLAIPISYVSVRQWLGYIFIQGLYRSDSVCYGRSLDADHRIVDHHL